MQHHRIDRLSLVKFKNELLHCLDGVVATEVNHYLLDLNKYIPFKLATREKCPVDGDIYWV